MFNWLAKSVMSVSFVCGGVKGGANEPGSVKNDSFVPLVGHYPLNYCTK